LADSDLSVEIFAVLIDQTANSVLIEEVAERTLGADAVKPRFAAKIVIDFPQKVGICKLRTFQCLACGLRR
jgi:uncharacterized protein CbrC (UPF0167 family)